MSESSYQTVEDLKQQLKNHLKRHRPLVMSGEMTPDEWAQSAREFFDTLTESKGLRAIAHESAIPTYRAGLERDLLEKDVKQ